MDEFNSDENYIFYCGPESLQTNRVAFIANKRSEMQYLDAISKTTEWSLFTSKTSSTTVIQVYAQTSNAEEAEVEWFCEDLKDLLELKSKKYVLFIIGDI